MCPFLPRVSDKPALGLLREGLKLFISHFLLRGAPEAGALRERATLCTQALHACTSQVQAAQVQALG